MKKLLVIAAAILSFSAANAQVVYAGFQSDNVKSKTTIGNTTTTTTQTYTGFFAGGAMNFEVADAIGIQPGLELSYGTDKDGNNKYSSLGVSIPIEVNYGIELGSDFKLYPFAGPSIYIALVDQVKNGNTTYDYLGDDVSRLGLGLSFGAWCDIKDMLRVKVGYDLGLLNRAQNKDYYSEKDNAFMFSVGYIF